MMGRVTHPAEKVARPKPARFKVYGDVAGEFRIRLVAGNGEILLAGEGYSRRVDANRALKAIKAAVMEAL